MGYHSREDFNQRYSITDRELPDPKAKKPKVNKEDWKQYTKQFPVKNDKKRHSGWDYDEDDEER